MTQSAFVLQLAPNGSNKLPEALARDQIMIGWAQAEGLLDQQVGWSQFNETVRTRCYAHDEEPVQAFKAAGQLWRFIREMNAGDLVLVPHGVEFFLAEVTGHALYDHECLEDNSAYRRPVRWLNDKRPLPRGLAGSALISRMRTPGICANSTDLLNDIKECLHVASGGRPTLLENAVHARLVGEIRAELHSETMDRHRFDQMIRMLLLGLGASECLTPNHHQAPNGAIPSLTASFRVEGAPAQQVLVHTARWQASNQVGTEAVDELVSALHAHGSYHGLLASCGTMTHEAQQLASGLEKSHGLRLELLDGDALAQLLTEHGIRGVPGALSVSP